MSAWTGLLVIALVGLATYAFRAVAIVGLGSRRIPQRVEQVLGNVGPAVLAALTVSLLVGGEGDAGRVELAEALAVVAAVGVAAWRRNIVLTLVVGMAVLWAVALLG